MVVDKQHAKYNIKRLSKIALAIVLPLLLLLGIAWHILRSDHAYVIRKVEETAMEYFDLNLKVGGYHLEWTRPYPLIRFQLNNLSIASRRTPDQPYLRINHASSEFNPWDLLTGDFRTHPFRLDSVWMHLHTDSLEYLEQQTRGDRSDGLGIDFASLPSFKVNYLDFHRENDYLKKSLWAKFSQFELEPEKQEEASMLHLQSNVFFEGLIFNPAAGGYLTETPARLDFHIYLDDEGRTLGWKNSTLNVGQNELALSGSHEWADTNRLHLEINTENIMLEEVRRLLNDQLKRTLRDIKVDQPIRAAMVLDKIMVPGWKDAIDLYFETERSEITYKAVNMTAAKLKGSFSSDCDRDGIGDPLSSCIDFDYLEGDFFGLIPASLQGVIDNMLDPHIEATGRMEVELPKLNSVLTEKNKATFAEGTAVLNFQYDGALTELVDNPFDGQDIEVSGTAWFNRVRPATADRTISSPSLSGFLSFDEDQTRLEDIDLSWMGSNIQLSGRVSNLPEFFFYKDQTLNSDLELYFDQLDLNRFRGKADKDKRQQTVLDEQRLESLVRQLANNINGRLQLRVDKLIYDTIYLTNLRTQLRMYSPQIESNADSAMIMIDSLQTRLMGRTPIFAQLTLSGDPTPEITAELYLPSAVEPLNTLLPQQLLLKGGRAQARLTGRTPLRSLLSAADLMADMQYHGQIVLDAVDFADSETAFPLQDLSGAIIFDGKKATVDQLKFIYKGAPFTLNGTVLDYAPLRKNDGKKAIAKLQLNGQWLDLRTPSAATGTEGRPPSIISPPKFFRSLGKIYPYAVGSLTVNVQDVRTGGNPIRPFHLHAELLPDTDRPAQHQLQIDSFDLSFGSGNYFRGNALVKNPDQPTIEGDVDGRMAFSRLGRLLPSKYIEMRSGDFNMDLHYRAPLYDTLNARQYLLNARIEGDAEIVEGELFYNYRDFSFQNISGRFEFDQEALYIRQLDMLINGNQLMAEGKSSDFFSFFVLPDQHAHIELNVHSPRFDFGGFSAPKSLEGDTLRILRKAEKLIRQPIAPMDPVDTTSAFQETVGYIDQLLDRGSLEMSTDFDEVVYEAFDARNVEGKVSLNPDTVQLHNLGMEVADGRLAVAGQISDIVQHEPKLGISVRLERNNVRKIFRQFNNFGQREINYENIEGRISAELDFRAEVNSNYSILPETMHGDLQVRLVGGELVDLKLFEKLSGFLFRNRDMEHVILDTLHFRTHIRGSDLYLDNFHLHSSPFDFEAQGRYSLGTDNNTRVLFSLPIGNLFNPYVSPDEMKQPDSERKGLFNILIEAKYKKGKMRFIWKPWVFNKGKYQLRK